MTDVLITAGELAEFLKQEPCVVIDTRNPEAYGAGHLPGAVNVHEIFTYLATSTPEGMAELKTKFADAFGAAGLSGKETAVIYEQSMNSGFGQSCRGYYLLTWLGYPKIKVLNGGFSTWKAAGMPVSTTHSISTAIMGVGVAKNPRALQWKVIQKIVWAWVLTIPAAGLMAYFLLKGVVALGWG